MKEYKALRADGKGWVFGYPVWCEMKNTLRIFEYINVCEDYDDDEIGAIAPYHTILPETLCQFVAEINGQRIFEGDIDTKGRVCIYSPNLAAFGFKHPNYAAITFMGQWDEKLTGRNIHDKN